MKFIKGITFAPFYRKNTLNTEQARESFDYMIENTGADFVILAPGEHISAFLNMMYRVSQNGETGFRPTRNFRRIMRRLHKKKNAIC